MKYKIKIDFLARRFYFLAAIMLLVVIGLVARMVDLSVIKRQFLQSQGNARVLRTVTEPAFRGMITDREGYPLAISTSVYSAWVNPKEFITDKKSLSALSNTIGIKYSDLQNLLQRYKNKEFAYLKRDLSPAIAQKVKALKLPGVYLLQSYKRFYPEGEVASQVIGFTNVDDKGQEGLELAYNDWLSGVAGKKLVVKDRLGRIISNVQNMQNQQAGHDLVLSLNNRIQYLAYRELMAGIEKNLAVSGSVIVLDVKTGEVLAMVNFPSFNPNNIAKQEKSSLRNRALTDIFEPGSTIKTFSIATALTSGKFKPDTVIDTYPGWMRIERWLVHDEHANGALTVTQILQLSSNVGMSKIILSLPPIQLTNVLDRLGFGETTGIGFPGEQSGRYVHRKTWSPSAIAHLSFGYGISVTALQLAHAYATIANDGVKMPLSLLRLETPPKGEQVMDPKVAHQMITMLQTVLDKGGTGQPARVPGYHVAGKTGTAWMVGAHGYEKRRYTSSFIGMAPATQPRVLVAVVIHDPHGKQYLGGYVSGPVFASIMGGALRILNIPPDDPDSLSTPIITASAPSDVPTDE